MMLVLLFNASVYAQSSDVVFKSKNLMTSKISVKEKKLLKNIFNFTKDFSLQDISKGKIALREEKLHYNIHHNISILGFANYESFDKLFEFYKKELCMGIGVSLNLTRKNTKKEK